MKKMITKGLVGLALMGTLIQAEEINYKCEYNKTMISIYVERIEIFHKQGNFKGVCKTAVGMQEYLLGAIANCSKDLQKGYINMYSATETINNKCKGE